MRHAKKVESMTHSPRTEAGVGAGGGRVGAKQAQTLTVSETRCWFSQTKAFRVAIINTFPVSQGRCDDGAAFSRDKTQRLKLFSKTNQMDILELKGQWLK